MAGYRHQYVIALAVVFLALFGVRASPAEPTSNHRFYLPIVSTSSNPKHGLAWSYRSLDPDAWSDYNISWYYNWGTKRGTDAPLFVEFVPMVWCDSDDLKKRALINIPRTYNGYILLANEPEFSDQCGISPTRVADLIHWARAAWPNAKLVAPQSHVCWWENDQPIPPCGNYPRLFTVENMILAYRDKYNTDPPLAAYGAHYGDVTYWDGRLSAFLDGMGISASIWYTEFNFCSSDMARFQSWLDSLNGSTRIERYAYWSNLVEGNHCSLADFDTGTIFPIGTVYGQAGYP